MTWMVILAVGAGSFLFRVGPLFALERVTLSERSDRLIRNGGTAAITALIVGATKHNATGSAIVPTLLAVAVGVALAARGASILRLLVCGGGIYAGSVILLDLLAR